MNPLPIPISNPIAKPRDWKKFPNKLVPDPQEGLIERWWVEYLTQNAQTTANAPQAITSVSLAAQSASIGSTQIPTGALSAGVYRVSFYARVTTPAGVSSSLAVTFGWTDGGVGCTFTSTAITGNTTATTDSQTKVVVVDASSPLTYATTYASNPAAAMLYKLVISLETLPT